jgi:hypothetical protein
MLQVLSRLSVVAGRHEAADAALDEAISLAATIAEAGPTFAGFLRELLFERDGRPGTAPGPEARADRPYGAPGERAFLRAARDLGEDGTGLFPGEVAGTAAVIERLRLLEAHDPVRYGPVRGLATSWHARLLAGDIGRPADALEPAGEAVRQLMRFSDTPNRIQAALTVALAVDSAARKAGGDPDGARRARERAVSILTVLMQRDPTYADDLTWE